ncbi:MAG TPA: nicotinate-nucleotide--dimethylbenzimidazole phosphoribosyltransferase [Burkholderiaceae bacterium]|nr:nicotinate-nucleotide--dimethylbenzimidazole phosphoribosyltransferase [Burkholderiaceae bacterium]
MSANRSLIASSSNPPLERALRDKLHKRSDIMGSLGELESLAVRLGLMQATLKPRLRDPQVLVFASDHGLAVDGIGGPDSHATGEQVQQLLSGQSPVAVFARVQGMELTVVDGGLCERLPPHDRLLRRKIAHGTRNSRAGPAMSVEQAHAAIRAGMEIADSMPGNAIACAGIGIGSHESAALLMSRLAKVPVRDLIVSGPDMSPELLSHLLLVLQGALGRHHDANEPVETLAALGGFEIAMMVGVMLVAAGKRRLIMVDGMAACAALLIASHISAAVTDYCVFCRSHRHMGLDRALQLFRASALLELGMQSIDGTGAALAWPLVRSAAALLTELTDGEEPGPTRPVPTLTAELPGEN